jgi:hypothetical protein
VAWVLVSLVSPRPTYWISWWHLVVCLYVLQFLFPTLDSILGQHLTSTAVLFHDISGSFKL